jgi:hypothetical protein
MVEPVSRHRSLISTPAGAGKCRRCRAALLVGYDRGLLARVDADPVDRVGEFAALVDGRWTYARLADGSLMHRDADAITAGQAGRGVYVEHRCHSRQAR